MKLRQVKCPYCDWEWKEAVDATYVGGIVNVVRGPGDSLRRLFSIRGGASSTRCVDLRCPHCGRTFEYEVGRNEVTR